MNRFLPGCGAPVIGSIAQSPTGGSIPGGVTLRVSLCAMAANGLPSPPAAIAIVQTPLGTNTNQIALNGIIWPSVTNLASYALFVSDRDDLICAQQTGALTAGANNSYTHGSITINGPFTHSTWALPSPYVSKTASRPSGSCTAA